ncbi:hypothetical protein PV326_010942 [Microctonus aethiopoides]|nr:hypothetical protein PV326_010942 [Microctonus aethiopoides]
MNGELSALVTGTKFSGLQISTGLSYFMAIPDLLEKFAHVRIIFKFYERLTNPEKKYKSREISRGLYIIGAINKNTAVPQIILNTLQSLNIRGSNIKIFRRLMRSGRLYTSESYHRIKKTDSSYIKFFYNASMEFGVVNCFVKVSHCICETFCKDDCNVKYFAIVKKCDTSPAFSVLDINFTRIYKCFVINNITAVDVKDLISVCFHINIASENFNYIIEPINSMENE